MGLKPSACGLLACILGLALACFPPAALAQDCEIGAVRLLGPAACERTGPESFLLAIRPEASPINPSPWYAFTLSAQEAAEVTIMLDYGPFRHRYNPKQKGPQTAWTALDAGSVRLSEDQTRAEISLLLEPGETLIAAQEILSAQEREAWTRDFARRSGLRLTEIGISTEQRPLLALSGGAERPGTPLIIVIGGQHPPEVPGTIGLRHFLETLAAEGAGLLETHAILAIPDLNPDGVAHGHWRLNRGLSDLNRDWGTFSQPETRAVRDELSRRISEGLRPAVLLDFHATRRDIYYIPDHENMLCPAGFATGWISAISSRLGNEPLPAVSASHTPGQGTAKTWFADQFEAPGITVEYGDETSQPRIRSLSEAAARALIGILSTTDEGTGGIPCAAP